jgi:alkylation response protein AidB-like acyl-CoA dehydrogenase
MPGFDRDSWPVTDPEAFRTAVRHWITKNWATGITVREWWQRLGDAGLTVPTWATSLGGIGATTTIQQIVEQELSRIQTVAPPLAGVGVHLVGPVLRQYGTPVQRDRHLRTIVDGTSNWCLLFEEPDVVSESGDIASTATRRGSGATKGWAADAVKLSTDADLADHGLLLVRTDPASTGREGLTCFTLELGQPTVSVQRLASGASVVVARGAALRADDVVGAVGDGWTIAATVYAHQQTSLAGRIRRGLIDVPAGARAGNLDRTTGDILTYTSVRPAPGPERRRKK